MVNNLKETKIIVCDDEKRDREELVRDIKEVWQDPVVEEAQSGEEVLRKLGKDGDYDFVFLDIYMDGTLTSRKINSRSIYFFYS